MDAGITDTEFRHFQSLMHKVAGIHLPPSKKSLVSGRLSKRLRERALGSFGDYYRLIAGGGEPVELQTAIELLTTNETYFFREPGHFEFLVREVLSAVRPAATFRVWSAASSTGEEAYSIAMVLMDKLGTAASWEVFGSDINGKVIERARHATYPTARNEGIPADYLKRFCLRGTGGMAGKLRVDPALRSRVRFARLNLNGDLKPRRRVRRDLPAQRHDLLRHGDEAPRRRGAAPAAQAGRLAFHRPLGEPERGHRPLQAGAADHLPQGAPVSPPGRRAAESVTVPINPAAIDIFPAAGGCLFRRPRHAHPHGARLLRLDHLLASAAAARRHVPHTCCRSAPGRRTDAPDGRYAAEAIELLLRRNGRGRHAAGEYRGEAVRRRAHVRLQGRQRDARHRQPQHRHRDGACCDIAASSRPSEHLAGVGHRSIVFDVASRRRLGAPHARTDPPAARGVSVAQARGRAHAY
jgi:chemotaxis protein methyltransferase CheR